MINRAQVLSWHWLAHLTIGMVVYLSLNWAALSNLMLGASTRPAIKSLAQLLVLSVGFFSMVFGALAARGMARWMFVLFFVVSLTCNYAVTVIIGGAPTRATGVWLFSESGQLENLLGAWGAAIAGLTLLSLAGVLVLTWIAERLRRSMERRIPGNFVQRMRTVAIAGALALPVAGGIAETRMGLAESNLLAFGIVALRVGSPAAPSRPDYMPANTASARKIVLVIDESVRPDVFAEMVAPILPWPTVNYGVGYSIANCSAASNALIRLGIDPGKINAAHDPRSQASIWAFAKYAGFKTTLIDGQLENPSKSQNFIGNAERMLIDDYIAADIGVSADIEIAKQLSKRLTTGDRELIVIVKRGSHFPYAANLPKEKNVDGLTLEKAYSELVKYTTKQFFEILIRDHRELSDILLFYTSDHGQYQETGENTHCRSDHHEDEYRVPLIVAGTNSKYLDKVRQTQECWSGGAHHQAMRSSVIEAMGYAPKDITKHLYPPLTHCAEDRRIPRYLGYMPFPTASNELLEFVLLPFRPLVQP